MAFMDFGNVGFSDLLNLGVKGVGALMDRLNSRDIGKQLGQLQQTIPGMASPYPGADRALAANQLRGFMTGQLGPQDLPNYDQLVKAQERIFARAGKSMSGNAAIDLASNLQDETRRYMNFLANVAGAGFNPAAGADLYAQIAAANLTNQRNQNAGIFDFLTDAANIFSGGRKMGLGNLGSVSDVASGISNFFSGDYGTVGRSIGDFLGLSGGKSGVTNFGAFDDVLSGGFGVGGSPGGAAAGAGGAGLSTLLGIGAPLLVGALASGLGQSPGGAFNPATGRAAFPGDPLPDLENPGQALGSVSGYISPSGRFSLGEMFESGEVQRAGRPVTLTDPRLGANWLDVEGGHRQQVWIPPALIADMTIPGGMPPEPAGG